MTGPHLIIAFVLIVLIAAAFLATAFLWASRDDDDDMELF